MTGFRTREWLIAFLVVLIAQVSEPVSVHAQPLVSFGLRGFGTSAGRTLADPFPSHRGAGLTGAVHFSRFIGIYAAADRYSGDCEAENCLDVRASTQLASGGLHFEYPTRRWRGWSEFGVLNGSTTIEGTVNDLTEVRIETQTSTGLRVAFGVDAALGGGLVLGPYLAFYHQPIKVVRFEDDRFTLDFYNWRPVFGTPLERKDVFNNTLFGIQLTWHPSMGLDRPEPVTLGG